MREIRFRGMDIMTGQWRFGDLVHNMKVTLTGVEPRVMVGGYEVNPETVGQFTGVKDIEGNDVYEGDILEYNGKLHSVHHPWLAVKWDDTHLMWVASRVDMSRSLFTCSFICTVVSNIHEADETMQEDSQ